MIIEMENRLRITVLGRLSMSVDGRRIAVPSAPKERKLLVLLLLRRGRVVPVPALIDELWGTRPPRAVRTALQTCVLNIRTRLASELASSGKWVREELVVTDADGYLVRTDRVDFDLREYEDLAARGESAFAAGDHPRAAELLRRAEEIWTGPILPDLDHGVPLESEITQLDQRRIALQESRIESELALGRHRELVGELSMLALRYPFHERVHEYLMRALHRSGRSVQALKAFHRLRRAMADEMGLELSGRIRCLHQEIIGARSGTPGQMVGDNA